MRFICAVMVVIGTVACANSGGGGDCSEASDTCADETICVSGKCEAAFPRVYAITDISLTVPTTDPNGQEWDTGGGAPDLYVKISVDGTQVAMTNVVTDQFSATYAGPYPVSLIAGSSLDLHAFDQDVVTDDSAIDCVGSITAADLRSRALTCSAGGETMTYSITPQ